MAEITKQAVIEDQQIKQALKDIDMAAVAWLNTVIKITDESKKMSAALQAANITQLTTDTKAYNEALKTQAQAEQEVVKLDKLKVDLSEKVRKAEAAKTKEAEKATKQSAALTSEYAKQSKVLNDSRNKAKDLALQYGENSKQFRVAAKEVQNLDSKLKRIDATLGQHQRNVGNYAGAWKSFGLGLLGGFGITVGLNSIVNGFKAAFNKTAEFAKGLSSLSSITGLTGINLVRLGASALIMARKTTVAAVDVLKAMELIGSARPELLESASALAKVTKATITLSEAANMELPETAESLMSISNQMNISADNINRLINVLAAGSKVGAAPIKYLSTAMEKSGTTAKMMGMSIEQLTGAIEGIAPFYKEAATAGNSFDKVLLKLKAKQIGYKDGVFDLNRAIDELRTKYASGTTAAMIFGDEHSKMGELLVQNQKNINNITKAVTGTQTAFEQAATNTDNYSGAVKRLGNNWSALLLAITNTDGAKKGVESLTKFIETLRFAIMGVDAKIKEMGDEWVDSLDLTGFETPAAKVEYLNLKIGQLNNVTQDWNDKLVKLSVNGWDKIFNPSKVTQAERIEQQLKILNERTKSLKRLRDELSASTPPNDDKPNNEEVTNIENITKVSYDLIKAKEAELALIRDTPAANEAETLSRNIKVKALEEEIKRLRELGTIKQADKLPFTTEQLKKETDSIYDYLTKADEDYINEQIANWEKERDALREHEQQKADIRAEYADIATNGIMEIEDSLFANRADAREAETQKEIEFLQKRLENEKLDEEQRAEIQKEIDKKERAMKQRNAKAEKQDALMKLGIDTALTIAKLKAQAAIYAFTNPVFAAGALAQIPFVLVSAGLTATAIAARKIPEYAKGTSNHQGGEAWLGDGGKVELVTEPTGKRYLTPDTPTLMNLPAGTKVTPGDKVAHELQMLTRREMVELGNGQPKQRDSQLLTELLIEHRRTRKAIEKQKPHQQQDISEAVRFEIMKLKMKN